MIEIAPGLALHASIAYSRSGGGPLGSYSMSIKTDPDERVPRVVEYHVRFAEWPAVADLDDELLRLRAEAAVASDAAGIAQQRLMEAGLIRPGVVSNADPAEVELRRVRERAARAVRPRPGRRPISDEEKLRILELFQTKGITETIAITGRAERTVRRYVADARAIVRQRGSD